MPFTQRAVSRLLHYDRPYLTLTLVFATWKAILFCLVLLAPGPGYDTSTTLLPPFEDDDTNSTFASWLKRLIASKFVRWDAIYFTQVAKRGYLYEQEWAFGWGHTQLLGFVTRLVYARDAIDTHKVAVIGVVLSHCFHWASTLVLYELTRIVFPSRTQLGRSGVNFALLASILHILSPAGAFLSAPYAEPLFSLLNFAGFYAFTIARQQQRPGIQLIAGLLFGIASTVRGNGLFSGILLAYEAVEALGRTLTSQDTTSTRTHSGRSLGAGLGGLVMGVIAVLPQLLAYQQFCAVPDLEDRRPWCGALPPSIYASVQKEYWGVGFLQYWTVSNSPLFLLATPMLAIMAVSTRWAWNPRVVKSESTLTRPAATKSNPKATATPTAIDEGLILRLALPQLILTVLACTTYHVQVITRLSSGYAVWYWWLADMLSNEGQSRRHGNRMRIDQIIVVWMIVYAVVQGSLFASFLPPA